MVARGCPLVNQWLTNDRRSSICFFGWRVVTFARVGSEPGKEIGTLDPSAKSEMPMARSPPSHRSTASSSTSHSPSRAPLRHPSQRDRREEQKFRREFVLAAMPPSYSSVAEMRKAYEKSQTRAVTARQSPPRARSADATPPWEMRITRSKALAKAFDPARANLPSPGKPLVRYDGQFTPKTVAVLVDVLNVPAKQLQPPGDEAGSDKKLEMPSNADEVRTARSHQPLIRRRAHA